MLLYVILSKLIRPQNKRRRGTGREKGKRKKEEKRKKDDKDNNIKVEEGLGSLEEERDKEK